MRSSKRIRLRKLERERDKLNEALEASLDNVINTKIEIGHYKSQMEELVVNANLIRRNIASKRFRVTTIIDELKTILLSYRQHLVELCHETEKECNLDWEYFKYHNMNDINEFLESYLYHRKDYYLYKIRADRLSNDLNLCSEFDVMIKRSDRRPQLPSSYYGFIL